MRRAVIVIGVVIVVSVGWVLGWQHFRPETPTGRPTWSGKVVTVTAPGNNLPGWVKLKVEPRPGEEGQPKDPDRLEVSEVRVDFTSGTPVRRRKGKGDAAALRPGQKVSAWCSGPIKDKYPPTQAADFIVIEE
jgi:hypothetical protein